MSAKTGPGHLVVFLGPSLPLAEARQLAPDADFRPPARQGDVFRVLVKRPRAIVLIDGVFEGAPSVWHHELRAAIASGVTVFGASSMGALRAVELRGEGMIGVGAIHQRYLDGSSNDDGDVALMHADASHGYRPLTVPLVNVLATCEAAKKAKALKAADSSRIVSSARALFFKDRTWPAILAKCSAQTAQRLKAWLAQGGEVDQKATDARACLESAVALVDSGALGQSPYPFVGSSFVRRRRLMDAHSQRLTRAQRHPEAGRMALEGTKRLLLAALAKAGGVSVTLSERERAKATVPAEGLAADEREFIAEIVALEAKVLQLPERFVADGPSPLEGLALEAVLRGLWR